MPLPQRFRLLTGALCILLCLQARAQQPIDSLKAALSQGWDRANTADILNNIAKAYEHISVDSSLAYASEALLVSAEIDYEAGQLEAYSTLVLSYANKGQFDLARSTGREGLALAEKLDQTRYMAILSSQLGRAYGRQGSYHGGLFYFKEALRVNETVGDAQLNASLYNGIGSMYVFLEEYYLAEEHYLKAMAQYEVLGDVQNLSRLHNNLAGNYYYLEKWEEALKHYRQALEIYQKLKLECLQVVAKYNIGGIYLKMDNLVKADEFLKESYELGKSCAVGDLKVHMSHDLGILADKQGRYREAVSRFDEAMEGLGIQKNYYTLSIITKTIYEFYDKRNDAPKALYYLELHNEAEDSLRKQADVQKIAQLTSEYEFNKEREALQASQEKAELTLQNKIARERWMRNLAIVVAVFLIILALNYYRTSNIRKTANQALKQQNQLILSQKESLQEKTEALTDTNNRLNKLSEFKENLTHMIAHDLKNALNSILAASVRSENRKMRIVHQSGSNALGLITNMLDVHKFEETDMDLHQEVNSVARIIEEARLQVFLLLEFKKLELVVDQEQDVLAKMDKDIMLRVLVNLLTNAIKYSETGAKIRLSTNFSAKEDDPELYIEIQDFGEGIPEKDLPYIFDKYWSGNRKNLKSDVATGLGLTFCKMAVEAHQGQIWVQSSKDKGTVFTIQLPAIEARELICNQEEAGTCNEVAPPCSQLVEETLRPFALKLKDMAVHEVSRINTLLREIRELDLNSDWPREVEIAMYQGDQAGFDRLVKAVIKEV